MKNDELGDFFQVRYEHWLEYSQFQCTRQNIPEEAGDLLGDVLCAILLNTDHSTLVEYMHTRARGGTRLDFLVMNILKRNLFSKTAPLRWKLTKEKELFECVESFPPYILVYDPSESSLDEMLQELWDRFLKILARLNFSEYELRMFMYRYFEGKDLKDWDGPESVPTRYRTTRKMLDQIIEEKKKLEKMRKF